MPKFNTIVAFIAVVGVFTNNIFHCLVFFTNKGGSVGNITNTWEDGKRKRTTVANKTALKNRLI